ncbi:MAG: PH domain-containing protein [Magnetococcales bacterium]|nr:PH domain-containing protein [Magnetococcales bacterium]
MARIVPLLTTESQPLLVHVEEPLLLSEIEEDAATYSTFFQTAVRIEAWVEAALGQVVFRNLWCLQRSPFSEPEMEALPQPWHTEGMQFPADDDARQLFLMADEIQEELPVDARRIMSGLWLDLRPEEGRLIGVESSLFFLPSSDMESLSQQMVKEGSAALSDLVAVADPTWLDEGSESEEPSYDHGDESQEARTTQQTSSETPKESAQDAGAEDPEPLSSGAFVPDRARLEHEPPSDVETVAFAPVSPGAAQPESKTPPLQLETISFEPVERAEPVTIAPEDNSSDLEHVSFSLPEVNTTESASLVAEDAAPADDAGEHADLEKPPSREEQTHEEQTHEEQTEQDTSVPDLELSVELEPESNRATNKDSSDVQPERAPHTEQGLLDAALEIPEVSSVDSMDMPGKEERAASSGDPMDMPVLTLYPERRETGKGESEHQEVKESNDSSTEEISTSPDTADSEPLSLTLPDIPESSDSEDPFLKASRESRETPEEKSVESVHNPFMDDDEKEENLPTFSLEKLDQELEQVTAETESRRKTVEGDAMEESSSVMEEESVGATLDNATGDSERTEPDLEDEEHVSGDKEAAQPEHETRIEPPLEQRPDPSSESSSDAQEPKERSREKESDAHEEASPAFDLEGPHVRIGNQVCLDHIRDDLLSVWNGSERIYAIYHGTFSDRGGDALCDYAVLTNARLLILMRGVHSMESRAYPLKRISGVQADFKGTMKSLSFKHRGSRRRIDKLLSVDCDDLVKQIAELSGQENMDLPSAHHEEREVSTEAAPTADTPGKRNVTALMGKLVKRLTKKVG